MWFQCIWEKHPEKGRYLRNIDPYWFVMIHRLYIHDMYICYKESLCFVHNVYRAYMTWWPSISIQNWLKHLCCEAVQLATLERGQVGSVAWLVILLMVQKSHSQPPGMYKTLANNGVNYQPQLVSRISEPSTVAVGLVRKSSWMALFRVGDRLKTL